MPHYADLSVDNIGGNMKWIAARAIAVYILLIYRNT
jgi:hypothetical protein